MSICISIFFLLMVHRENSLPFAVSRDAPWIRERASGWWHDCDYPPCRGTTSALPSPPFDAVAAPQCFSISLSRTLRRTHALFNNNQPFFSKFLLFFLPFFLLLLRFLFLLLVLCLLFLLLFRLHFMF